MSSEFEDWDDFDDEFGVAETPNNEVSDFKTAPKHTVKTPVVRRTPKVNTEIKQTIKPEVKPVMKRKEPVEPIPYFEDYSAPEEPQDRKKKETSRLSGLKKSSDGVLKKATGAVSRGKNKIVGKKETTSNDTNTTSSPKKRRDTVDTIKDTNVVTKTYALPLWALIGEQLLVLLIGLMIGFFCFHKETEMANKFEGLKYESAYNITSIRLGEDITVEFQEYNNGTLGDVVQFVHKHKNIADPYYRLFRYYLKEGDIVVYTDRGDLSRVNLNELSEDTNGLTDEELEDMGDYVEEAPDGETTGVPEDDVYDEAEDYQHR